MIKKPLRPVVLAIFASVSTVVLPQNAMAQSYPIDCAILLCLSGGWPASIPCARAKAEFVRRITPWPVEPPLQIWRCPMGASLDYRNDGDGTRVFDIRYEPNSNAPLQSSPRDFPELSLATDTSTRPEGSAAGSTLLGREEFHLVRDQADIDIGVNEFDFVRSIRVFHVQYASQYQAGSEGDCERAAQVLLGSYGTQGGFSWQSSSTNALPERHQGLEQWGKDCQRIDHRSVFVDWRDYEGNYGFEQVNY